MFIQSNLKHYSIVAGTAVGVFAFAFFLGGQSAGSDNTSLCTNTNSELHQQLETARKLDGKDYGATILDIETLKHVIANMEKRNGNSTVRDSLIKESQLQLEKVNKNLKGLQ